MGLPCSLSFLPEAVPFRIRCVTSTNRVFRLCISNAKSLISSVTTFFYGEVWLPLKTLCKFWRADPAAVRGQSGQAAVTNNSESSDGETTKVCFLLTLRACCRPSAASVHVAFVGTSWPGEAPALFFHRGSGGRKETQRITHGFSQLPSESDTWLCCRSRDHT